MLKPEVIEKLKTPVYLDDSVYAQFNGYDVVLTTNNGFPDDPRNKIYMSPSTVMAYQKYLEKLATLIKEGKKQ